MPKITQNQQQAAAKVITDADVLDDQGVFSGNPDDQTGQKGADDGKKGKQAAADDGLTAVTIGDKEIRTDAATAALLEALQTQNTQLFAYLQSMQGQNKQQAPQNKQQAAKGEEYDYETGLFTEPKVAVAKLRDEIKAELKAELTGAYQAAETEKEFWNTFYDTNKDLKQEKILVDAIVRRDWAKLSPMPTEKAAEHIANAVKKELLRLSGGKSKSDDTNRGLEGGSTRTVADTKTGQNQEEVVGSLSAFIRQRQEARRKAMFQKE